MKTWKHYLELVQSPNQANPGVPANMRDINLGTANVSLTGNTLSMTTADDKSVSLQLTPQQVMTMQQLLQGQQWTNQQQQQVQPQQQRMPQPSNN